MNLNLEIKEEYLTEAMKNRIKITSVNEKQNIERKVLNFDTLKEGKENKRPTTCENYIKIQEKEDVQNSQTKERIVENRFTAISEFNIEEEFDILITQRDDNLLSYIDLMNKYKTQIKNFPRTEDNLNSSKDTKTASCCQILAKIFNEKMLFYEENKSENQFERSDINNQMIDYFQNMIKLHEEINSKNTKAPTCVFDEINSWSEIDPTLELTTKTDDFFENFKKIESQTEIDFTLKHKVKENKKLFTEDETRYFSINLNSDEEATSIKNNGKIFSNEKLNDKHNEIAKMFSLKIYHFNC